MDAPHRRLWSPIRGSTGNGIEGMDEDLDVAQARGAPTRGAQEGSAW